MLEKDARPFSAASATLGESLRVEEVSSVLDLWILQRYPGEISLCGQTATEQGRKRSLNYMSVK